MSKAATKTPKKPEKEKKPNVKLAKDNQPKIGHNSGQFNAPLAKLFTDYERLEANKKEIGKAQRDIRAKAKEEFGIQIKNFSQEIAMRKLDPDVRIQFEQGVQDLKGMLGYQFAFNIASPKKEGEGDKGEGKPEPKAAETAKEEVEGEGDDPDAIPSEKNPAFLRKAGATHTSEAAH
jgi:uncharacterized protein (UPF0335 family)